VGGSRTCHQQKGPRKVPGVPNIRKFGREAGREKLQKKSEVNKLQPANERAGRGGFRGQRGGAAPKRSTRRDKRQEFDKWPIKEKEKGMRPKNSGGGWGKCFLYFERRKGERTNRGPEHVKKYEKKMTSRYEGPHGTY